MVKFRLAYVRAFGGSTKGDALYEAVSEGRRHPGVEHWMPLFHDKLDTLFDYMPDAGIVLDAQVEEAAKERLTTIADYYDARKTQMEQDGAGAKYKPLPPDALYLTPADWDRRRGGEAVGEALALRAGRGLRRRHGRPRGTARPVLRRRAGRRERQCLRRGHRPCRGAAPGEEARSHRRWSEGSRERLQPILEDHGLKPLRPVASWPRPRRCVATRSPSACSASRRASRPRPRRIGEQDIPRRPVVRAQKRRKRAQDFLSDVSRRSPPATSSSMSITASAASSA